MPAKKNDFTKTEIAAGIMVIAAVAAVALFIAVLSGMRKPEPMKAYYSYFTDTGGLNRAADVRFGGVKVGKVTSINPDPSNQSRVRVEFEVKEDTPVNEGSRAFATQVTLTAEKHLEVTSGAADAALLPPGGEIPFEDGSLFGQVGSVAGGVSGVLSDVRDLLGVQEHKSETGNGEMVTIEKLFGQVNDTVDEGAGLVGDVRGMVKERGGDVADVMAKLKEIEDSAHGLVSRIDGIVADNEPDIRGTITHVRGAAEGADALVAEVSKMTEELETILALVEGTLTYAQGTAGEAQGILMDSRPVLDDMLLDLRETVRHLKEFSRTMAEHPEAVLRGKSAQGRR